MMKTGTPILFLTKRVEFSVTEAPRKFLVEVPAVYMGESEVRCRVCHEKQDGHDRGGRRRHPFEPETESTIEVHYPPSKGYPEGQVEIRQHVPQGTEANCWKEK